MATEKIEFTILANGKPAVKAIDKVDKKTKQLGKTAKKAGKDTDKTLAKMKRGWAKVGAGAAIATAAFALTAKAAIKYAASIEDLKIQLKFLTGSTEAAGQAFDEMTKFASKTPFALQDIQKSAASLLVAVDSDVSKLGSVLETAGEISAQFGLSFIDASLNLQRAMSAGIGAADLFRDKGVSAMMGFRAGVSYTTEDTARMIQEWTVKNRGAIAELSETFNGKVSMMGDAWDKVLLTMGEAGALDGAKEAVDTITEQLKDPETIKLFETLGAATGELVKGLASAVSLMIEMATWIHSNNMAESKAVDLAMEKINAEKELARIRAGGEETDFDASERHLNNFIKSMEAGIAIQQRVKDAQKEVNAQFASAAKSIQPVFNITDKLTKKRTQLEGITDAQTQAEGKLNAQLKAGKITQDQYTESLLRMQIEISKYVVLMQKLPTEQITEKNNAYNQSLIDSVSTYTEQESRIKTHTKHLKYLRAELDKNNITQEKYNELKDSANDTLKEANDLAETGTGNAGENFLKGLRGSGNSLKDNMKEWETAGTNTADKIAGAFADMASGTKVSFKDMTRSILADLAKIAIKQAIVSAISGIGSFFGFHSGTAEVKHSGGAIGSASIPSFHSGMRSDERVAKLQVGEGVVNRMGARRNPGAIDAMNKGQSLGGNTTVVNVTYSPTVNALDPRTAQIVIAENAPTVVGIVRQAFNKTGQSINI